MRGRVRFSAVAVAICVLLPLAAPRPAMASPVDDQQRKVSQITDELERLEQKAATLTEDYVVAIDNKNRLDAEVAEAETRVAAKQAEVDSLRAQLADVAVRSFVGGGGSPLGPLFNDAGTLNDELQRDQLARVALSQGAESTDELDSVVSDLDAEKADLQDKRDQAASWAEQVASAQAKNDKQVAEYQTARVAAEAELGNLLAEEEARRAAESLRRVQAEAAAKAARDAADAAAAAAANNQTDDGDDAGTSGGSGGGGNAGGGGGNDGGGATPAPAPVPEPAPSAPPPSSLAAVAIQAARSQLGVPYRYASSLPGVAFDCSGLTMYAWGQAGVSLPHQSRAQAAMLPHVEFGAAQPGDLIFYYSPISHVGIYIGGGAMIDAPNSGSFVRTVAVNWNKVAVVGRPG